MSSQQNKITGVPRLALLEQLMSSQSTATTGGQILPPVVSRRGLGPQEAGFLGGNVSLHLVTAAGHRALAGT